MNKFEIEVNPYQLVELVNARMSLRKIMGKYTKYTLASGHTVEYTGRETFEDIIAACIPEAIKNYKEYASQIAQSNQDSEE